MKKNNSIKRILLVSPIAPPAGGMATWTDIYRKEIAKRKIDMDIVNISRIGNKETSKKKFFIISEIKRFLKILKQFNKYISNNNYDIIHINSSCSKLGIIRDYICVKKAFKMRKKIVMHYHCDITFMITKFYQKKILERVIKYSNVSLVLNSQSVDYIEKIGAKNVYLVPNFIDKKELLKNEKKINEKINKIIYTGRINDEKGCDLILKIAKIRKDIQFEMIGNILLDLDYYKPSSNVILYGEKSKEFVLDKLKTADVFIFPTHFEGFSISLLEAMANGLPVITTNVGSNKDMIDDKGGIICKIDDIQEFLQAIEKLNNPNMRKNMSQWNINKVHNSYLKDRIIDNIIEIYNENI